MDEVIMTGAEEEVRWQKTLILSLEKQHIELNEYMNEWIDEWKFMQETLCFILEMNKN